MTLDLFLKLLSSPFLWMWRGAWLFVGWHLAKVAYATFVFYEMIGEKLI